MSARGQGLFAAQFPRQPLTIIYPAEFASYLHRFISKYHHNLCNVLGGIYIHILLCDVCVCYIMQNMLGIKNDIMNRIGRLVSTYQHQTKQKRRLKGRSAELYK